MIGLICALIFIICWIAGLIYWLRIVFLSKIIKNELNLNYPDIKYSIGISAKNQLKPIVKSGAKRLMKMMLSFGSEKESRHFVEIFVDINAIEKLDNKKLNDRINKFVKLFSIFSRTWIIGIISILIALLFWANLKGN